MTADFPADPEMIRRRTAYGYMNWEQTGKGRARVEQYLADGDPRPLEGTRYAEERLKVVDRLTAKEREELGMGAKQRQPKPKLRKPAPDEMARFDRALKDPNAEVQVYDSRTSKLMVIFGAEGELTVNINCEPVEAAALLHGLSHLILEAEEQSGQQPEP